ncbi:hypothetical protein BGX87_23235 [Burkholderia ubonensis]|nr:hypothetical protein [Burkholderia ubonensis]OJA26453.1 hypothetical protein BGX87_23235 [Burkholderia ubonensis]
MNIVDSAPGHDARAVQIGTGYLLTAQAGRSAQHRAARDDDAGVLTRRLWDDALACAAGLRATFPLADRAARKGA